MHVSLIMVYLSYLLWFVLPYFDLKGIVILRSNLIVESTSKDQWGKICSRKLQGHWGLIHYMYYTLTSAPCHAFKHCHLRPHKFKTSIYQINLQMFDLHVNGHGHRTDSSFDSCCLQKIKCTLFVQSFHLPVSTETVN